jgi:hypothetical protein
MRDQDMRGGLAQAAHDYVRDVAANVWSVTVAAEDHAAAMRAEAEDVTSGDVYVALAWTVVDAARDAAVDAVSDAVAAAFGAAAAVVAERVGAGDADHVFVGWSDDTDAAEDAGYVVPVVATYGDAFAVVDAYGCPSWVDDLADMLVADMADQAAAV